DELEHHLDQRLPLARHAGRGLARGEPKDEHHEQAHGHRADQRVHVDREEATLARLRRKVLQMVLDVAGWGQFRLARHVSTRPVDDTVWINAAPAPRSGRPARQGFPPIPPLAASRPMPPPPTARRTPPTTSPPRPPGSATARWSRGRRRRPAPGAWTASRRR